MKRDWVISLLSARQGELRSRFGVAALALFGSVARDEAKESSDVDVLVTFDGPASFDQFMDLKFYLQDVLAAPVDLVTQKGLRERLRDVIEKEAIYVA